MDPNEGPRPYNPLLTAERIRADLNAGPHDLSFADDLESRARQKLPESLAEVGAGGELVPTEAPAGSAPALRDTLADPDHVAADASRFRLELANQADCLELALDTSDTMDAQNSVEKMLAHQLAAAHQAAMRLAGRAVMHSNRAAQGSFGMNPHEFHAAEAARAASAAARMMDAFQKGALTLQKLRTGGQQVVTVQHVEVNEGGQAVVAGKLSSGGPRRSKRKRQ